MWFHQFMPVYVILTFAYYTVFSVKGGVVLKLLDNLKNDHQIQKPFKEVDTLI